MLLDLKIKVRKIILAIYAKRYGINHNKTQLESKKLDELINKYYEKHG